MRQARPQRRSRRQVAEINVVPYIDVMLVLLVIFMITAPLLQTGVEIDLPEADASPIITDGETQDPLILKVDADGSWFLNIGDDPEAALDQTEVQRLASAALRLNPEKLVLVAADTNIAYGELMQAMVTLQKAGAPKVNLMSKTPR